jgi:DnaJ family protein A protein 2
MSNYYDILGISKTVSIDEIKKAYKKMCLKWHPDKNPDNIEEAKIEFQKIQEAYEVLSDDEKRNIYDKYGKDGLKQQGHDYDPGDIFSRVFGGNPFMSGFMNMNVNVRQQEQRQPIGPNKLFNLELSLEDIYNGCIKNLNIKRRIKCGGCNATGSKMGKYNKCETCNGSGMRMVIRQLGPGMIQQSSTQCNTCNGIGKYVKESDKCDLCKGGKYDFTIKLMEVELEKGIKNGEHIRLKGMSDEVDTADEAGDIILEITEKKRDDIYREGDNLVIKKAILLSEALCGLSISFVLPNGEMVLIESDKIIKPNMRHTISGLGFYNKNRKGNGDLIFEFEIVFPENLQDTRKDLIKKLLPKRLKETNINNLKSYKIEKSEDINNNTKKENYNNVNQEYEPIPDINNCPIQ